jgi:hypothetical protein
MITRLLAMLLILPSLAAFASKPSDRDVAADFLVLCRMHEAVDESLKTYEQQLLPTATPEDRAKWHQMMEGTTGWDAIKDPLTDLVMKIYTRAELEASIAFMKTPLGASATLKQGEFSRQFSMLLITNLRAAARKTQAESAAQSHPAQ